MLLLPCDRLLSSLQVAGQPGDTLAMLVTLCDHLPHVQWGMLTLQLCIFIVTATINCYLLSGHVCLVSCMAIATTLPMCTRTWGAWLRLKDARRALIVAAGHCRT